MSLTLLSSLEPNLFFLKILIFRGDILKNVCKEMPSLLASIFPLHTLIPDFEFEKKVGKNLVFSTTYAAKKGSTIAQSIDNFVAYNLY